jgi:hypothetical protein
MQNGEIAFETVAYPSTSEAMAALEKGEVDCVFPVNLSVYDTEELKVLTTSPLMQCEMEAVVRSSKIRDFSMNASLASYSYGEQEITLAEFVRKNIITLLACLIAILAVIFALLLRSMRSEKKTREAMEGSPS